jgi:hypothetical protein
VSQRPATLPDLLPNGAQAVVTRDKLKHYSLAADHEDGGGDKARLWRAIGGYELHHAAQLQTAIRLAAKQARVTGWRLNRDGSASWQTRTQIPALNGRLIWIQVRWRTTVVGTAPRLTSAWPEITA